MSFSLTNIYLKGPIGVDTRTAGNRNPELYPIELWAQFSPNKFHRVFIVLKIIPEKTDPHLTRFFVDVNSTYTDL